MRWDRPAPSWALAAAGLAVLLALHQARARLAAAGWEAAASAAWIDQASADRADALDQARSLSELRAEDLASVKAGLAKLTLKRQANLESGLELQEEKRLLEKQLQLLTTYLLIDEEAAKVSLMSGDQAQASWPFRPPLGPTPASMRIVSKERFAHPEPGKFEQVEGKLRWEPPQAGPSLRANALGSYVLFTDGPLILHGPPKKPKEHAAYPHACLHLGLAAARALYEKTFIGTRIRVKKASRRVANNVE